VEYTTIPNEPMDQQHKIPPISWPEKGEIIFDNVQMRYRPGMQLVLKGLTLHIYPSEKIGIVGRTVTRKGKHLIIKGSWKEQYDASIIPFSGTR
jgi:ABC-type multidrug transport system fused ATPase/permease subunit